MAEGAAQSQSQENELERLKKKWGQGVLPIYRQRLQEGQRASRVGNIANGKVVLTLRHLTAMGSLFDVGNIQNSLDIIVSLLQKDDDNNKKLIGKGESSLELSNEVSELQQHGIFSQKIQQLHVLHFPNGKRNSVIGEQLSMDDNLFLNLKVNYKINDSKDLHKFRSEQIGLDTFDFEHPQRIQIKLMLIEDSNVGESRRTLHSENQITLHAQLQIYQDSEDEQSLLLEQLQALEAFCGQR